MTIDGYLFWERLDAAGIDRLFALVDAGGLRSAYRSVAGPAAGAAYRVAGAGGAAGVLDRVDASVGPPDLRLAAVSPAHVEAATTREAPLASFPAGAMGIQRPYMLPVPAAAPGAGEQVIAVVRLAVPRARVAAVGAALSTLDGAVAVTHVVGRDCTLLVEVIAADDAALARRLEEVFAHAGVDDAPVLVTAPSLGRNFGQLSVQG